MIRSLITALLSAATTVAFRKVDGQDSFELLRANGYESDGLFRMGSGTTDLNY